MSTAIIKTERNTKQTEIIFDGIVLVSELLKKNNSYIAMPCAGNHTCGKCKIKATGNLIPSATQEQRLLTKQELADGIRLACFVKATGDFVVELLDLDHSSVVTTHQEKNLGKQAKGYHVAVDIGTTTIATYLYHNGVQISAIGEMNLQGKYGADVISRIDYSEGNTTLHETIVSQLNGMLHKTITSFCYPEEVRSIVITGNTTMLHFLMGYEALGIAVYPFTAYSLFDEEHSADILFEEFTQATLYLPPCISSYVGADMVCSILASGMLESDQTSILADIGTNGEMALVHKGKLFVCSTAAGPAFEGANIKMGMAASHGAIDDVFLSGDTIEVHTIANARAKGICGSGIINAVALLLDVGIIDESGLILDEGHCYTDLVGEDEEGQYILLSQSGVVLTQKDIRQIQLAKSAINAGILTLIHECLVDIEAIETLYLCGGFGSFINPEKAARISLIPQQLSKKVVAIGNGAGMGACMMIADSNRQKGREVINNSKEISLSTNSFFMNEYVEQMLFKQDR